MTRHRVDSLDTAFAPGFGAREEGATPVHVSHETPVRAKRIWVGRALRVVRDAAIAVGVIALVPIAVVAINGDRIWGSGEGSWNIRARVARAELVRPFALPADPSITPTQAGLAFAALLAPPEEKTAFAMREPASRPEVTWRDLPVSAEMFIKAPPRLYKGPGREILEAVAAGFSPAEKKYLHALATAPVWREFDIVARAPAADLIGGRFQVPFAEGLSLEQMPDPKYGAVREVANAAMSRAAYHMSLGQRDSAEAVLRSIVSFGFVLMDNGTSILDEFIGNVIVNIGRDALLRFYTIAQDPRANLPALAPLPKGAMTFSFREPPAPVDEVRARLIARVADPSAYRAERYAALRALSEASCTNARELVFGPRSDVVDAISKARRDLARYPSEQALVDLTGRAQQPEINAAVANPIMAIAVSAGTVAGTVLGNPRLATCAYRATNFKYFPR